MLGQNCKRPNKKGLMPRARNNKGQAYLIVSLILVMLMFAVAFVSRTQPHQRTEGHFLMENIEREIPLAYTAGIFQNDLNRIMIETSNNFKTFSSEKGYTFNLVFSGKYTRGVSVHYLVGNWSGADCTYYNSKRSPVAIANGTTATFPRAWLNNDYDLIICGHTLDLKEDFDYRAEIRRQDEIVVSE
ncbi:MAG: hypothetical protein QXK06_04410 [Candidatus Diapherotrites archaeon]